MNRKLRAPGLCAIIAILPFVTASGALAAPAPKTENLDSLGNAESNEEISSDFLAEAHSAERSGAGNLISVTWSVENIGDRDAGFDWPQGNSYMYSNVTSYSGVTITSSTKSKRFHPLMDSDGDCLCSGNTSMDVKNILRPGEKVAYWSMYSVPEDVDSIDLEIPGFEPIEDIPIS
ncbi:hypothetical protein H4W79_003767 [Nocardiopsis terrae]|uniref:DUF4352 domain-containing protein n=2 Tax=Nocardiopsis terrae TaxID=372655 RepID=A0ABR9HKQ0_9ACTN|nr:hypothetical protein [Nocardiopsis terrae]